MSGVYCSEVSLFDSSNRAARVKAVEALRAKRPKPVPLPIVPQAEPNLVEGKLVLVNRQFKNISIRYTTLSNTLSVEENTAANVNQLLPSQWIQEHKPGTQRLVAFADTVDRFSGSKLSKDFAKEEAKLQDEVEKNVEDLLEERKGKLEEKEHLYLEGKKRHWDVEHRLSELHKWGDEGFEVDSDEEVEGERAIISEEISGTEQFKEELEWAIRLTGKSIGYDKKWLRKLQKRYDAQFKNESWSAEEKEQQPHCLETKKGVVSQIENYKRRIRSKIESYEELEQTRQEFESLCEKNQGDPEMLRFSAGKRIKAMMKMLRIESQTFDNEILKQIKVGFDSDLGELGNEIRLLHNKRDRLKKLLAQFV